MVESNDVTAALRGQC